MANHNWIKEKEYEYGTKPHKCKKCGIRKTWHGGDYNAWQYTWNVNDGKNSFGEDYIRLIVTWNRPECGSANVL